MVFSVHQVVRIQPPPQALHFSHRRGERETRVTGDEPQGTMGRVQTARAHFHRERDVWVRGRFASLVNRVAGLFYSGRIKQTNYATYRRKR